MATNSTDQVTRDQVLSFRVRAQQLDRESTELADAAILDAGVQETGPDGAPWALANRGVATSQLSGSELATVWTIRGAPHTYRRADLPAVATAVQPYSDADAGKRIFDAAKQLKAAGLGNLAALEAVAAAMKSIVTEPTVKGEVSTRLTELMDPPYLRFCRRCDATHVYELPFRLAALRAGLELQTGTSPPVLQPIPDFAPATQVPDRYDVIRAYLKFLGPAAPKQVAEYLDAPVRDVRAHWPSDAVEVSVDGRSGWVLATDVDALTAGPVTTLRLLGPYDLFLQARDRPLLVGDPVRAKVLWPVLGRPGAVLADGELAGIWRPRHSGKRLKIQVEMWGSTSTAVRRRISEQAERLAEYRQAQFSGVDYAE